MQFINNAHFHDSAVFEFTWNHVLLWLTFYLMTTVNIYSEFLEQFCFWVTDVRTGLRSYTTMIHINFAEQHYSGHTFYPVNGKAIIQLIVIVSFIVQWVRSMMKKVFGQLCCWILCLNFVFSGSILAQKLVTRGISLFIVAWLFLWSCSFIKRL